MNASALEPLLAAYNAHDASRAASLYTADGEHREVAQGTSRRGREAIEASLGGFLRAFPDARWATVEVARGEQVAAASYVLSGTLQGRLGPIEPAGQRLEIEGVIVLRLHEDLIAVSSDYWDMGTFLRQMRAG